MLGYCWAEHSGILGLESHRFPTGELQTWALISGCSGRQRVWTALCVCASVCMCGFVCLCVCTLRGGSCKPGCLRHGDKCLMWRFPRRWYIKKRSGLLNSYKLLSVTAHCLAEKWPRATQIMWAIKGLLLPKNGICLSAYCLKYSTDWQWVQRQITETGFYFYFQDDKND